MRTIRTTLIAPAALVFAALAIQGPAFALENPTTGHRGAPNMTCGSSPATMQTPGNAANAAGSPFNPNGTSGMHYAGNPGTSSVAHANSTAAVSQYDIACINASRP
jgi:hypothetical protein